MTNETLQPPSTGATARFPDVNDTAHPDGQGYQRRDFLKIVGASAGAAGLVSAADIAAAERKPNRPAGPRGLTWRGTWTGTSNYVLGDAVARNGASWFAKTSSSNATPILGSFESKSKQENPNESDFSTCNPQDAARRRGPLSN